MSGDEDNGGDNGDQKKACGAPCPRCNDPNVGYCIKLVPPKHAEFHECGNDGTAWPV
jgi:hypothetical protein